MAIDKQRNWFIRVSKINNTKDKGIYEYDFDELYNTLVNKYEKVVMALHNKDTSNIHCHIILQNKNQIRFETLKKLIPYGDIEKQQGSNAECYNYLFHKDEKSKEKEKDEYDESCIKTNIEDIDSWLKVTRGQRTDLVAFKDAVLGGATFDELLEEHTIALANHLNFYNNLKNRKLEKDFMTKERDVECVYIYGSPGTGKTYSVFSQYGFDTVYSIDDYLHPFDEYESQNVLLLDEYRHNFDITYLLKLLDRYPLKLRARYGNKVACYTKVYIISNIPLDEQYKNADDSTRSALYRRIHKVIHYTGFNEFDVLEKDKKFTQTSLNVDDIF